VGIVSRNEKSVKINGLQVKPNSYPKTYLLNNVDIFFIFIGKKKNTKGFGHKTNHIFKMQCTLYIENQNMLEL